MANKRGPDMMTGASASSSVSQAQAIPQPPRKRFAGYRDTLKFSAKSEVYFNFFLKNNFLFVKIF